MFRCAGSERSQQVAQGILRRFAAGDVDQGAQLIDMLDRVLQRRLPAGEQRDDEKKPRRAGAQVT